MHTASIYIYYETAHELNAQIEQEVKTLFSHLATDKHLTSSLHKKRHIAPYGTRQNSHEALTQKTTWMEIYRLSNDDHQIPEILHNIEQITLHKTNLNRLTTKRHIEIFHRIL
jgi:hypothetical protein